MADVCVVNKIDSASPENVESVFESIRGANPRAGVVRAASPIDVEGDAAQINGKRVLAIEDGPTLTREMTYGAAVLAARANGAAELVDPRACAVGSIRQTFEAYPHMGPLASAMGYGNGQITRAARDDRALDADVVLVGTPIDLRRLIDFEKPALRVTYRLEEIGEPTLVDVLKDRSLIGAPALV